MSLIDQGMGDGDRQFWHEENPDLGSDGSRGWGIGTGEMWPHRNPDLGIDGN